MEMEKVRKGFEEGVRKVAEYQEELNRVAKISPTAGFWAKETLKGFHLASKTFAMMIEKFFEELRADGTGKNMWYFDDALAKEWVQVLEGINKKMCDNKLEKMGAKMFAIIAVYGWSNEMRGIINRYGCSDSWIYHVQSLELYWIDAYERAGLI